MKEQYWEVDLDDELETKINNYKKLYNLHENEEVLSYIFDNILNLEQSTLNRINKICTDYKTTKEELLTPIIEKYLNKTLKNQGVVKVKNKHTSRAESELLEVLKNMVEEYKQKPLEERKYITASLVYRYLIINNYKQKNMSVIKRVLSGLSDVDISFIKEYHQENNLSSHLSVSSNLKHSLINSDINIDNFADSYGITKPVLICNKEVGYCPTRVFGTIRTFYSHPHGYDNPIPPTNYRWWFSIFYNSSGTSFDVFYPSNYVKGEKIFIKVKGDLECLPKTITWIHDENGLCEKEILPIYLQFVHKHTKNNNNALKYDTEA